MVKKSRIWGMSVVLGLVLPSSVGCGGGASSGGASTGGTAGTSPSASVGGLSPGGGPSGGASGGGSAGGATSLGGASGGGSAGGATSLGGASGGGRTSTGGSGGSSTGGTGGSSTGGTGGSAPLTCTLPSSGSALTRAFSGSPAWETEADLDAFCASYDGVRGSVQVNVDTVTNLDKLACLVEVTGQLEFNGAALERINLPNLVAVGNLNVVALSRLTAIELPKLATATGEIRITSPALTAVELSALRAVGQDLVIATITPLESIRLPALTEVCGGANFQNSQLKELMLPALRAVGGDLRMSNATPEHLSLSSIVRVNGYLSVHSGTYADVDLSHLERVGSLSVAGTAQSVELTELVLPQLQAATAIGVSGFPGLSRIDVPSAAGLSSVTVVDNPVLDSASFPTAVNLSLLQITAANHPLVLGLPALETAELAYLRLSESVSLSLPRLRSVTTELQVYGALGVDLPELTDVADATFGQYLDAVPTQGFDLSLPKLVKARNLTVAQGAKSVEWPVLNQVTALTVRDTWLTELDLPLGTAPSVSVANNTLLGRMSAPNLTTAGGLGVDVNPVLATLELPQLGSVTQSLYFSELPALTTVTLPALTSAKYLEFVSTAGTTGLVAPELAIVGTLMLSNSGFVEFALPSVTRIDDALSVTDNGILTSVSLPNATGLLTPNVAFLRNVALSSIDLLLLDRADTFAIQSNRQLGNLDGFPALTQTFDVYITDNTLLANLDGLAQLDRVSGNLTLYGNPLLTEEQITAFVSSIGTITGSVILTKP